MKIKLGVFGSAISDSEAVMSKARAIGHALARQDVIIITGACPGVPYAAAFAAFQSGKTEVWGYSPAVSYEAQCALTPGDDNEMYARLIYTPANVPFAEDLQAARKYRNVVSTATCDGGIIVAGRWGTLNEFTNMYDMGKVIGVLTGTGGVADEIAALQAKIYKPGNATLVFEDDPENLVEHVLSEIKTRQQ